jgi:ubiquitin-activating enzyme E1
MLQPPDLAKFGRSEQLHVCLFGIYSFLQQEGRYPDTEADVAKTLEYAKSTMEAFNAKNESSLKVEIDEKVFAKFVQFASCSISPMAAFFGGLVAQEIVKYTGKYSPLKQWLHFDIEEALPKKEVNRQPLGCRYDDQIKIFGQELQETLKKLKIFMVGAGALGCELIKAFALMGIGCSEEGMVHVTDNDNIEVSNLNRQFLFRKQNVGHSKSQTACQIAKGMNNSLNVTDYMTRVGADTEEVFNDDFWESLNLVVNAVDNINARLYVDGRCVWYEKPLLESGTLGTKCNSQMVIPHKTQCYGDSQDPPEEAIPMCTLRNFPNQIEHCIEWARDKFNELFVDTPGDLISYLDNPKLFVAQLKSNSTSSGTVATLERIVNFIKLKNNESFEMCVSLARDQFDNYFDFLIRDLLSVFPKDSKDKSGQPFWSGPKRAPSPIPFDVAQETHLNFVLTFANLIAVSMGLP